MLLKYFIEQGRTFIMDKKPQFLTSISASLVFHRTLNSNNSWAAANFTITPQQGTTLPTLIHPGGQTNAWYTITNRTSRQRNGYLIQGLPTTVTQNTQNPNNCQIPINLPSE